MFSFKISTGLFKLICTFFFESISCNLTFYTRLSDELLEMILSKEPAFFERLVMELLNRMGYAFDDDSVIVTKYTGDEGIDGIIKEDKFGFSNIYVQAKRWNGNVGRPEIQKFLGAVAGQADLRDYLSQLHLFQRTRSILRKNNYK